jgi:hypothetical protein
MEYVRGLVMEGELQHIDLNVTQYLAEITDKETGAAIVELATIAERIGRSRSTVVRSLQRLIDAAVIEREARRRGNRCFASLYRLVDPVSEKGANGDTPRFTDEPTPVHQRTTSRAFEKNLSPNWVDHGGADANSCIDGLTTPAAQPDPARQETNRARGPTFDLDAEAGWLALKGEYKRWEPGPGRAFELAREDLVEWCGRCGERAIALAIRRAKDRQLFGDPLIDFLCQTWPRGRRI